MQQAELLNPELSWLEFNSRVLNEALDARTPLLERVRFLSIFHSNLDEFFMKRVGGLKRQVAAQVREERKKPPLQQLAEIRKKSQILIDAQTQFIANDLRKLLEREGIQLLALADAAPEELERADRYFKSRIFPVLTPLSVDPGHPFPFLSNLSISLGVLMRQPGRGDDLLFARIKMPDSIPNWIRVDAQEDDRKPRFVSLHDLVIRHFDRLFPGMEVHGAMAFRITRNADLDRVEDAADDLLQMIADELKERKFADIVRLETGPAPDPRILAMLRQELELEDDELFELKLPLELFHLKALTELNRPELKYAPWVPATPAALTDETTSIFKLIRDNDILVHHPYESFAASVERYVHSAADDPHVVAIKMTLYRTGDDSPFIPHLIRAAEAGKQVVVLVELKARFDEAKNIRVAQRLENAGVHVVYGVVGLKTHCKLTLVVRSEPDGVRSYAHIGTGNYHTVTARLYTDVGLFTARPDITEEVIHLFHYLTGRSLFGDYRKLLVAPLTLRERLVALIERETENARQGKPARIVAKMNGLADHAMTVALCAASEAGVKIDLIVRGMCTLRPGLKGQSENIRVFSVIGRFLEHSRIWYFQNGSEDPTGGDYFIGSADWMTRNLNARVEAAVPVEDPALRARLWEILSLVLEDERQVWAMKSDGTYRQKKGSTPQAELGVQQRLMEVTLKRAKESLLPPTPRGLALRTSDEGTTQAGPTG